MCARNICLLSAIYDISIHIEHKPGKNNIVADLLSRFKFDVASWHLLEQYVTNFIWIHTHIDLTKLKHDL